MSSSRLQDPDVAAVLPEMDGAVHRLHRCMSEERLLIDGVDTLRCTGERLVGVAIVARDRAWLFRSVFQLSKGSLPISAWIYLFLISVIEEPFVVRVSLWFSSSRPPGERPQSQLASSLLGGSAPVWKDLRRRDARSAKSSVPMDRCSRCQKYLMYSISARLSSSLMSWP
jgi:hypothetical protein